jgi:hypothetical protein
MGTELCRCESTAEELAEECKFESREEELARLKARLHHLLLTP